MGNVTAPSKFGAPVFPKSWVSDANGGEKGFIKHHWRQNLLSRATEKTRRLV